MTVLKSLIYEKQYFFYYIFILELGGPKRLIIKLYHIKNHSIYLLFFLMIYSMLCFSYIAKYIQIISCKLYNNYISQNDYNDQYLYNFLKSGFVMKSELKKLKGLTIKSNVG